MASRNMQTARAGEAFVVAELNRRGAYATSFAGNLPNMDIIASSYDQKREIFIQVKTKRAQVWQTSSAKRKSCEPNPEETKFWIFVDLKPEHPEYYICPEWWIRNNIDEVHWENLKKHGGKRPVNPKSTHHPIATDRLAEWKDRWDILKLF